MVTPLDQREQITGLFRLRLLPPCLRSYIFQMYSKEKLIGLDGVKKRSKYTIPLKPTIDSANILLRGIGLDEVTRGETQACVNTVFFKTKPDISDWEDNPSIEVTKTQLSTVFVTFKDSLQKMTRAESAFFEEEDGDYASFL